MQSTMYLDHLVCKKLSEEQGRDICAFLLSSSLPSFLQQEQILHFALLNLPVNLYFHKEGN